MDVSVRKAKIYTRRYVSAREIYELVRRYRISKNNPAFSRTIATVRACDDHEPKSHYLVMYRWAGEHLGPEDRNKVHNYRKDTKLLKEIDDMLQKGMSTDRVYNNIAKKKEQTMSETVTGPKVIVIGSMPQRKPM